MSGQFVHFTHITVARYKKAGLEPTGEQEVNLISVKGKDKPTVLSANQHVRRVSDVIVLTG